ncbi:uncharacterized protein LOC143955753 [Lithobates pipiens]
MMEPPNNRNPPERCPRPLYSRDSTQEDHTIPHHHQIGNLGDDNIFVKEEFKEEDEEYGVMEEFSEGHKDMMEPPNTRNPPERCPRPLYSRDSPQEDHTIPHCYKSGDPIDIEFEVKSEEEEEERYVRDDQQSMEEDGIMGTFIEEDTPTEISTVDGREMRKTSEDCLTLSPDCKVEDEDITQYSPGENPTTSNVHPAPHSVDGPSYSSYPEEPQTVRDGAGPSYSSYPEEPQTVRDGAGPSYSSYPEEPQTVRDGAGPSYSSYPEEPQTVRDGAGPSYSSYPEELQTTCIDQMTARMRMKEDRSHMTEKILNLTLEIIYLLTGESFPPVKSGEKVTITISLFHNLKPERHNLQKILEVTKKMVKMMTGEESGAGNSGTLSMEEWEYLEGHKDLYKDVMMDNQPPLTSPDGSSNGNPPERCPRPLYSRDSTQEGHTIPRHHQSGNLGDCKVEVKSEEEEEERYVRDDQQSMEEDGITGTFIEEDTPTEISTGGSLTLNPFLHPYCSLIGPE